MTAWEYLKGKLYWHFLMPLVFVVAIMVAIAFLIGVTWVVDKFKRWRKK